MNDLEQRLNDAAEEIRRTTTVFAPPPITVRRGVGRGWAMAAAGFVVVLALGVIPLLIPAPEIVGTGTNSTLAGAPKESTVYVNSTTGTGAPAVTTCSATGMRPPAPQPGLPDAVAVARDELATAAIGCDFDRLEALTTDNFITSFGGGGFANLERWEDEGERPLEMIILLLDTPYGVQEPVTPPGDGPTFEPIYAWPAAFTYDTWEEVPQEQKDELATIYDQGLMAMIEEFGAYALWRIGITESGGWRFYVAGD